MKTIAIIAATLVALALAPAQSAAAHEGDDVDTVTTCSTTKRAGGKLVTRVRWESGRQVRRVGLTAETRLFPGERVWWTVSKRKTDPRVVSCKALANGTVVVRTAARARYAFVPPEPAEVAPSAPAAVARWTTPVTLSVPGLDASWQAHEAAAAWNVALPGELKITVTDVPCGEGQTGCIPAQVEDLTGVPGEGLAAGETMWGGAWQAQNDGVMEWCRIGLNAVDTPAELRPYVMAHELGHCLGLPHWETEGHTPWTVMSTRASGSAAVGVTEWDVAWLSAVYAG